MLDTSRDRLDYGGSLMPPEGYMIDAAVATTYSLDLDALLAAPIAMCFNNTLEGDVKGEKLALLEAMSQLQSKMRVFYQKGNIHCPDKFNRLFTLLEPCLHGIVPDGGEFSSFHPKLWLLRFVEENNSKHPDVCYRLIVLSRNISFDRSWDVAVCLDGVLDPNNANGTDVSWLDLIESLLGRCDDFSAGVSLQRDLPNINWQAPKPFSSLELHAGSSQYGSPVVPDSGSLQGLLVVSPFLMSRGGGIDGLTTIVGEHANVKRKILCSREEELNAIVQHNRDTSILDDWECYVINPAIVDGEESLQLHEGGEDQVHSQNLHAKIVVRDFGRRCEWWLGSANATAAALGSENKKPRNTELMVKLMGGVGVPRPDQQLDAWLKQGLFLPHDVQQISFEQPLDDNVLQLQRLLQQVTRKVIEANWCLKASLVADGYEVELQHDLDVCALPNECLIRVSQLDLAGSFDLLEESQGALRWSQASLLQLSSFIVVDIIVKRNEHVESSKRLLATTLEVDGGDQRSQAILKAMVDSPEKVLNYVQLLLHAKPEKFHWLELDSQGLGGQTELSALFSANEPIFEQLMMAAARHPEVIVRVDKLIGRLIDSSIDLPESFLGLWQHFSSLKSIQKIASGKGR